MVIELFERDDDAEMADAIEAVLLEAELRDGVWRYLDPGWRDSDQSHDSRGKPRRPSASRTPHSLGAARSRSAMLSFDEDDDTTPSRESPPLGSGLWLPPSPTRRRTSGGGKAKTTNRPQSHLPGRRKRRRLLQQPTAAAKPTVAAKTWAAVAGRADAVPPYAPPEGKASKFAVGATQTGIDGRPWVVRAVPNAAFKSEWWPYDPVQRQPLSLPKLPKPVKEAKAKKPKEAKAKMPKPSEVEMAGGSASVDGPGGLPRPHPPPGWAFLLKDRT